MSEQIIGIAATLAGTIMGGLFSSISSMLDRKLRKDELAADKRSENMNRLKKNMTDICDQYATFYRLERLYLQEIQALRRAAGKENEIDGIRNEFRAQVYKDGNNARIKYNDSGIFDEKERLMAM